MPRPSIAVTMLLAPLLLSCGRVDSVDTRLSTDLAQARFTVVEWPPAPGSAAPSLSPPTYTKCALRLRDERTGTLFVLQRSAKRAQPNAAGGPETWSEVGDYLQALSGTVGQASRWVRIECGTWKVLGVVARPGA